MVNIISGDLHIIGLPIVLREQMILHPNSLQYPHRTLQDHEGLLNQISLISVQREDAMKSYPCEDRKENLIVSFVNQTLTHLHHVQRCLGRTGIKLISCDEPAVTL